MNVGKNLADKIEPSKKCFESYITKVGNDMIEFDLSYEELDKAFQSLQQGKRC